jgi:DNA mismatch repair protein MutL
MGKIARLSDGLINQIAAGEVVERPASVVKELAENSLDAGATSIRVELVEGGLKRISVTDDGSGMSSEDARLCLERHATSKLRDAEGLGRIGTMGFRGEALPSIASVSKLTLTTREKEAVAATRIRLEGGTLIEVGDAGAPVGTQVAVEDLFFNTPARRKFAKKPETEFGHCAETVTRLALARPDVSFQLVHNGRITFNSPGGGDPRERVAAAISPEVFRHLMPVEHRRGDLMVKGVTTSPDFSLATSRGLYTFVNRRFIRDRGLIHAIIRAYSNVLPPGRQPAAVLDLTLPLDAVDVNVHPQKLEVRFVDSRGVYDAVVEAVKASLRDSPWLKTPPMPMAMSTPGLGANASVNVGAASVSAPMSMPMPMPMPVPMNVAEPRSNYAAVSGMSLPFPMAPGAPIPTSNSGWSYVAPQVAQDWGDGQAPGYFSALRYVGQLARTYLVCEAPGGTLVLIDQHAAHERLRFDTLRKQFASGPLKGQPFLFPVQLTLSVSDTRALLDHLAEVQKVGFDLEPFGGETLALKSVPTLLAGADYSKLLTDLAHEFAHFEQGRAVDDAMNHVLATMACHSAVRAHQTLTVEEVRALLDDMDRIDFKTRCPHGRPVAAELTLSELERRVHRR